MSKMQRKPPRPPMQLTCDACGKTFVRAPSKYKAKYNFCSEACAWTAHRDAVMGRAERVRIQITRYGAVCGHCTMRTAQSAKGGNITDEHAAIRLVGLCKMDDSQL